MDTKFWMFIISLLLNISSAYANIAIGVVLPVEDDYVEEALAVAVSRKNTYSYDLRYQLNVKHISHKDVFRNSKDVCDLINQEDGVVAIIGAESPSATFTTHSICKRAEVPHIQTSWNPALHRNSPLAINFHPDPDLLQAALGTLVRAMDWKNYIILYEEDEALIRLQKVLEIPRKTTNAVVVRQLSADHEYRLLLKTFTNSTVTRFIVDCKAEHIVLFLEQARDMKILDGFHSFLFTSLDAHTVDWHQIENHANITTISIIDVASPMLRVFLKDLERVDMWQQSDVITVKEIRTKAALAYDAITLLMDALPELNLTQRIHSRSMRCEDDADVWEDGLKIATYMKKFDESGKRIDFALHVTEIMGGASSKIATWRPQNPHSLETIQSSEDHEKQVLENLQKQTVIVSSKFGPPYLMMRPKTDPSQIFQGNAQFQGFSMDLIDAIASELNFTYEFRITEGNLHGKFDPVKGRWTGLIGDLLDNNAHLAICDLTITHQRQQVVDFSSPFMDLGIAILYKEEDPAERNIFAFMEPFSLEVWLYTVTAYLGVSLVLYCVSRMAPGDWENPHPCDENPEELENIWTLKNCLWLTLGSIMTQGCDILPKGISSRMSASIWWFFSLLVTSSYTANLAAFLTMQRMGPQINNAEGLAQQTKIKYGLMEGGATEAFFKESNYTTYARMWTQMEGFKPSVFERSNEDGVKRVLSSTKNQPYAFLMESSSIEYITATKCNLKQIGEPLDSKRYGIAMPMNAPYRSAINKVILNMQEQGNLTKLKTKWWQEMIEGGACPEKVAEESSSELGLENVGGVFVVLAIGIAVAILLSILEFLWNVQSVAVEQHVSFTSALMSETKFVINVWETKKLVKPDPSEATSSGNSLKQSDGQRVQSFPNIENITD